MRFVNLRRVGDEHAFRADIQTDQHTRVAMINSGIGHRAGHMQLFDESGAIECRGMRHDIDYENDRVSIRLPRGCLGRPQWLRVSIFNLMGKDYEDARGYVVWKDNPHNDTATSGITRRLYREQPSC
jgi:hypothetical protein